MRTLSALGLDFRPRLRRVKAIPYQSIVITLPFGAAADAPELILKNRTPPVAARCRLPAASPLVCQWKVLGLERENVLRRFHFDWKIGGTAENSGMSPSSMVGCVRTASRSAV